MMMATLKAAATTIEFCFLSFPLNKGVHASYLTSHFSQESLNLSRPSFFSATRCFLGAAPMCREG